MEKIDMLKSRKAKIYDAEKDIKSRLFELIDDDSLIESQVFSFSKNEIFDVDALGEGVVTGYATIDDFPIYVICQNLNVLSGGVSKAQCKKIVDCLKKAEAREIPVLYVLNSLGVQVGESVGALEGIAEVLCTVSNLSGNVPQISIVNGDLFGSFAAIPSMCDFNFMLKNSCLSYASPLVISAGSGKNLPKEQVGGAAAMSETGLTTFVCDSFAEIKKILLKMFTVLPQFSDIFVENDDDLNRVAPDLNEKVCAKCLGDAIFDKDTFIELSSGFCPEVKCGFARIGGISSAVLLFDGGDKGVSLNEKNLLKIKEFCYLADEFGLPLVNLVNTLGIETNLDVNGSFVMKEVGYVVGALSYVENKFSVVYGKAIGLGYSLFAAKNMGYENNYAFCNSSIGLFEDEKGAVIELASADKVDAEELKARYSAYNDATNAAANGYIDNVIEPQYVRQYIIAALQTLV